MKKTSVIVPCYIFDDILLGYTRDTLSALRCTTDCEIIVIDDGSFSGHNTMRKFADIYIANDTNLGFVKSVNKGLKAATCEYIVVGNNDYIVEDGWEEGLMGIVDNIHDCGTVTPSENGEEVTSPKKFWYCGLPGSFHMMKRETFEMVGYHDEQFTNAFSDTDYAFRMFDLKLRPYQTSLVKAKHYKGATVSKVGMDNREFWRDRDLFIDKWKGHPYLDEKALRSIGCEQG